MYYLFRNEAKKYTAVSGLQSDLRIVNLMLEWELVDIFDRREEALEKEEKIRAQDRQEVV